MRTIWLVGQAFSRTLGFHLFWEKVSLVGQFEVNYNCIRSIFPMFHSPTLFRLGLKSLSGQLEQKFADRSELPTQAVFRVLSLKPGFKDTNFQCNQEKFKIIAIAGSNPKLSEVSINIGMCIYFGSNSVQLDKI